MCQDIHYGIAGPQLCPTCQTENAFVEVDVEEATKIMGI